MTGWWVTSLSPTTSTIQSFQTADLRVGSKEAVSAGISDHLLPGLWSLQAFALFRDDFWRPVSASKDSVPNSRALSAKLDRTALAIPTFGPL